MSLFFYALVFGNKYKRTDTDESQRNFYLIYQAISGISINEPDKQGSNFNNRFFKTFPKKIIINVMNEKGLSSIVWESCIQS